MRKKGRYILLCFFILLQIGCSSSKEIAYIGLIETTGQKNESYITFLDQELNFINQKKFSFGSMGSPFDLPKVVGNNVYVIPKGVVAKDLTIVMEYNVISGKVEKFDMGQQNMNSLSVSDNDIFTVNTLNKESIISRCDKSSKQIETIKIPSVYICKLDYYDNVLYAFGEEMNENNSHKAFLYVINLDDFSISETIDISESGTSQYYSTKIGEDIYFTNQYDIAGNPGDTLSKFNTESKIITNYIMSNEFPYQIFPYDQKLIISHYDLVQNKGNNITIFDPLDSSFNTFTFENDIGQIYITDDMLYSADMDNLYVYDLTDFNLKNTLSVHTKEKEKIYYYFSSFFLLEE